MKNGFTLIEILIALVIMAVLVSMAVVSVGRGMKDSRTRDAARTVAQYARHARGIALLKQRPAALAFEEIFEGGEFVKSRISISYTEAETAGGNESLAATTLLGNYVSDLDDEAAAADGAIAAVSAADAGDAPDPLRAEPREFEGIRLKASVQDEEMVRPRISVFSNAQTIRRADAAAAAARDGAASEERGESVGESAESAPESSYTALYEANGRCDPFTVKVWREGADEDDALEIKIGRFGRVVTGE